MTFTLPRRSLRPVTGAAMYVLTSAKTTDLNAYVTGIGASKRIVVWDTTIAKMNPPQIVFVAGHEMGTTSCSTYQRGWRSSPFFYSSLFMWVSLHRVVAGTLR